MYAIGSIVLAMVLGIINHFRVQRIFSRQFEISELQQIKNTFSERFGVNFKDFPTMKEELERIEEFYYLSKQLNKEIQEKNSLISESTFSINQGLIRLGIEDEDTSYWGNLISKKRFDLDGLIGEVSGLQSELDRLSIDESDYFTDDSGIQYSKSNLDEFSTQLRYLYEKLSAEESALDSLKSELRGLVGEYELVEWEELLQKAREKRLIKLKEYKKITANIIAGNLLNRVVESSREQEDEEISEILNSDIIKIPIFEITQKYTAIEFDSDSIYVIDQFNEKFSFEDLSTGAHEQILLALRIGFLSKIMQEDKAFLILDDAFQHSDWDRRPRLVESVLSLADQGWQIIYFTMDDHIRDVFDKKAKKALKSRYKHIDLN